MSRNFLIAVSGLLLLSGYLLLTKRGAEAAKKAIEYGGEILEEGQDIIVSMVRQLSSYGRDLIKKFEGFSNVPYKDATGWSIGYGHYMGSSPTMRYITQEQGDALLANDTESAQSAVRSLVTVPLNQNQFDALVSLVYNIGAGAFGKSTLLRLLNAGDYEGAAKQFDVWKKSEGKTNPALVARRAYERQIFES